MKYVLWLQQVVAKVSARRKIRLAQDYHFDAPKG
jgi:hypothetical protein